MRLSHLLLIHAHWHSSASFSWYLSVPEDNLGAVVLPELACQSLLGGGGTIAGGRRAKAGGGGRKTQLGAPGAALWGSRAGGEARGGAGGGGGGGSAKLGAPGAAHCSAGARTGRCCVVLRACSQRVGLVGNDEASKGLQVGKPVESIIRPCLACRAPIRCTWVWLSDNLIDLKDNVQCPWMLSLPPSRRIREVLGGSTSQGEAEYRLMLTAVAIFKTVCQASLRCSALHFEAVSNPG